MILIADLEGVMYSGGAISLVAMIGIYVWLIRSGRTDVTDSPWFWAMLFSGCALVGVLFVGPKYARREASLELKAIGRTRAVPSAAPRVGDPSPATDVHRNSGQDFVAVDADGEPITPPAHLLVPLYALAATLAGVFLFACAKLSRNLRSSGPERHT